MRIATVRQRVVVTLLASIGMLILAPTAQAVLTITIDLGTPAGEAGYTLTNFGPVEPTTHPGGWGGIAYDPASNDRLCRTVWGYDENTKDASITFPAPITSATIRHLDGGSDDSFIVEVDGSFWGGYSAVPGAGEFWTTSSFSGTTGTTMTITCTGPAGSYWNPYGQLGVDRIEAAPIPEPATLTLLALGGLALLRKRSQP